METLNMEPTYRVVLGDVKRFRIMLVSFGSLPVNCVLSGGRNGC